MSTRYISASAAFGCSTLRSPKLIVTASNSSSPNGSFSASASTNSMLRVAAAALLDHARPRSRAATTVAPVRARAADDVPVPAATSRMRSPGCGSTARTRGRCARAAALPTDMTRWCGRSGGRRRRTCRTPRPAACPSRPCSRHTILGWWGDRSRGASPSRSAPSRSIRSPRCCPCSTPGIRCCSCAAARASPGSARRRGWSSAGPTGCARPPRPGSASRPHRRSGMRWGVPAPASSRSGRSRSPTSRPARACSSCPRVVIGRRDGVSWVTRIDGAQDAVAATALGPEFRVVLHPGELTPGRLPRGGRDRRRAHPGRRRREGRARPRPRRAPAGGRRRAPRARRPRARLPRHLDLRGRRPPRLEPRDPRARQRRHRHRARARRQRGARHRRRRPTPRPPSPWPPRRRISTSTGSPWRACSARSGRTPAASPRASCRSPSSCRTSGTWPATSRAR